MYLFMLILRVLSTSHVVFKENLDTNDCVSIISMCLLGITTCYLVIPRAYLFFEFLLKHICGVIVRCSDDAYPPRLGYKSVAFLWC